MVHPQPGAGADAVRAAELRRRPVVFGDEGAEFSGPGPADHQRQRRAARRLASATRDRRRAQDREFAGHAAGPEAHLHQGAGRQRHVHHRIPARKTGAGGTRRRALRGGAGSRRPAGGYARPDRHQARPGRRADPGLHRRLEPARRGRPVLVRGGQHRQAAVAGARCRRGQSRGWCDARDRHRARPGASGLVRHRRRRHLAPVEAGPAGSRRRPRRYRQGRAGGAGAGQRRHRGSAEKHRADAARRAPRAPGSAGARDRRGCRTALAGAARRQTGGRLRGHAQPRRQRSRGRRRGAQGARRTACRRPRPEDQRGLRLRHPGGGGIRWIHAAALRRRDPGGDRGVAVPARLARHLGLRGGVAAVGDPGLHRHARAGFLAQRRDPARALAGGRHPGRRRHRRGREHHAPPAHGQITLPGGDGGGRRDRIGGDRHDLHPGVGIPADGIHERHRGQVLQAVRLDRLARGDGLAAGGAHAHADDGRLPAEGDFGSAAGGRTGDARLPAHGWLVRGASLAHHALRGGVLRRVGGADPAAADRLHPARRHVADAGACRTAAGIHAGADPRGSGACAHADRPGRAREKRLYHHRQRRRRQQPVRTPGPGRSAPGDADRAARWAPRPGGAQAGDRARVA